MIRTLIAAALIALVCVSAPAFAQAPATSVTIPVGDWLAQVANGAVLVLTALVAWGFRQLPAQVVGILMTLRVDQLLTKAIEYGMNTVVGAVKDKELTVNVGNEVLANALAYVLEQAPGWLVNWVGGEDGLRRMIIARLPVAADTALQ